MQALLRAGPRGRRARVLDQPRRSRTTTPTVSRCRPATRRTTSCSQLAAVCREFDGTSLEMVPDAGYGSVPRRRPATLMVGMSAPPGAAPELEHLARRARATARRWRRSCGISDQAQAAGGNVFALFMPMPIHLRLNFASGFVLDMLPGWDKLMALPDAEKLALLRTPEGRRGHARAVRRRRADPRWARWERYLIYEGFTPRPARTRGARLATSPREEGKDPWDALCDIVVADDLRTTSASRIRVESTADWEARARVLRDPRIIVGASDAGAHLDMIDTFSYTTHLFQDVRARATSC